MKVSTKGRYALRIMLDLAFHNSGELVPLKDIAKRQNITLKYMEQIISPLSKAGFVISLRGSNGGYRLARKPSEYTAGDICAWSRDRLPQRPASRMGSMWTARGRMIVRRWRSGRDSTR